MNGKWMNGKKWMTEKKVNERKEMNEWKERKKERKKYNVYEMININVILDPHNIIKDKKKSDQNKYKTFDN